MISLEQYVKNPCGLLSIPYYKARRMGTPAGVRVVHARDFHGDVADDETDTPYFRLRHDLHALDQSALPGAYRMGTLDRHHAAQLAALLETCYQGLTLTPEAAEAMRTEAFAFASAQLGAWTRAGTLVGCCLGTFDAQAREGVVDWLAVHPLHRRKGIARALVNACVEAYIGYADFMTVSGQVDNPSHPEAVYRKCGFTGGDVWHVLVQKEESR